ncbi:MAG: 2-isopropylmalate synthase [Magnetococcales bacterium]|nr:2-isopropylmalate synthase [Magnetococcales bacterium]MBF0262045.1 2-isopropylmalate synthase [Magnetococcales bacterium]
MSEKVFIFDTTLRDGEQSPGASMTPDEKLRVARQLEKLKVDVIEAGFPISSPGNFESVRNIARAIRDCSVAGLARARDADIDRAWEALREGANPRIHLFIATSPIHMRHKLGMAPDQVVEAAVAGVRRAKRYTSNVEWSAEDAGRSEMDFLCRIVEAVIEAGATTVNIPDTVGYTLPHEFGERIHQLMSRVPNVHRAVISVHCHNDLGLATANSLAAVRNGARQVECTINGLGERAGNAALEEVVMALRTRRDIMPYHTDVITEEITTASRLVSRITGFPIQPNKAIVGANAFAHESGIHQDGMLKDASTYEIMTPASVGLATNRLVLGKHSGRHAFAERLRELGYQLPEGQVERIMQRFKDLADKKKNLFDDDIRALVDDEMVREADPFKLTRLHVASGTEDTPVAAVEIQVNGHAQRGAGWGEGAIHAVFNAIVNLVPGATEVRLQRYEVRAITGGIDAQADVIVNMERDDRSVQGRGVDNDVVVASALAFLNALAKLARRPAEQSSGV